MSNTTFPGGGSGGGPLAGLNNGGIWQKTRFSIPADPTSATTQGNTQEISAICEASPQVLSAGVPLVCGPPGTAVTANAVIKLWYTCGFSTGNICYAETVPPFTTVAVLGGAATPTVLIANHAHGRVFKNGSTYHEYACNSASNCTQIDHYTSSNGTTWSLAQSAVIGLGSAGAWDSTNLGNNRVWVEGSTWYMLYEAIKAGNTWSTGIATSTDGAGNTWTKNAAVNPLCTSCGGPDKYKDPNGNYWIWTHSAVSGSGIPSDVFRWQLTGLTTTPTLTASPSTCVLCRGEADEGFNSTTGQLADASHVEVNGGTLVFYESTFDGSTQTAFLHGRMAFANLPWASVVQTNEGIAPSSPAGNEFNMLMVGATRGIPGSLGGIGVNNSVNAATGYPGAQVGQVSNGGGDIAFFGINEIVGPSGARFRVSSAGSAGGALWDLSTSGVNAGVGAFLSLVNTSGTETIPINTGLNGNGNAQIILSDTLSGGVKPTLTGTGACATFSGAATGGANAGQFTCTGTTGAATVTLAFNTTATNGWSCSASDVTHTLAGSQVTPISTSACTVSFTTVTSNDVITFQAKGY